MFLTAVNSHSLVIQTMDLSNLKGLLESHQSDSPEVSDEDLEDELNAILSGKAVPQKPKPMVPKPGSAANVKRVKQNDSMLTKSGQPGRRGEQQIPRDDQHCK